MKNNQIRKERIQLTGLLPVWKPHGVISKDVSRLLERKFGRFESIGHVGTLDPLAEGALPILLGRATRLQDILLELPKTYFFEIQLGHETDTLDLEGEIIAREKIPVLNRELLIEHAKSFVGRQTQIAPAYSAIKIEGKPAYIMARKQGASIDEKKLTKEVTIYSLDLVDFSEQALSFRISCSKGTYVRSVARDFARKIGTVGTVTKLVREVAAGLEREQFIPLASILEGEMPLASHLISIEDIGLPSIKTDDNLSASRLKNGQTLEISNQMTSPSESVLLRDVFGEVFGLARTWIENGHALVRMKRSLL